MNIDEIEEGLLEALNKLDDDVDVKDAFEHAWRKWQVSISKAETYKCLHSTRAREGKDEGTRELNSLSISWHRRALFLMDQQAAASARGEVRARAMHTATQLWYLVTAFMAALALGRWW